MKFETKFNIDDDVYPIRQGGHNELINCKTCEGIGNISIKNNEFTCPYCHGSKVEREWKPNKWTIDIDSSSKIGKIDVEKYREGINHENRIVYMLDNSGVGSGTCWHERDLFYTHNAAQKECDIRNAENK